MADPLAFQVRLDELMVQTEEEKQLAREEALNFLGLCCHRLIRSSESGELLF